MPFAMKVEGLAIELAGKPLFQHVEFEIAEGERVALLGRNGIGKTTLIRCLMGRTSPDAGSVLRRYETTDWGWLEQHSLVAGDATLLSFVRSGHPRLNELRVQLDSVQRELETATTAPSTDVYTNAAEANDSVRERLMRLTDLYGRLHEQYLANEGYNWEVDVEQTLSRFGFRASQHSVPFEQLSGGEKTRAQFARLVISNPKLLVLDEPTNHLDEETLVWLEGWLKSYTGTVLFVSHDRSFIDAVADAVIELTPEGTRRYPGGYTAFRAQRDTEIQAQQALYEKQQREKKHLKEAIQQYRVWYQRAHTAAGTNDFLRSRAGKNATRMQAKQRALDRLEAETVKRPQRQSSPQVEFANGRFEAKTLITMRDVTFSYGDSPLFEEVSARVSRGDKIAIVGRNGTGKSTLLKLLTGRLEPVVGEVEPHPALRVGFFAQELEDLDLSESVIDTILQIPDMTQSYARTVLAGFLFPREDVFKRAGDLSMGERCRLAFVKLYFSGANLLVLDEPTNYLDVDTRERVEDALALYPGSLLVVSHDRYLSRKVANQIWHLNVERDGTATGLTVFDGRYDEWRSSQQDSSTLSTEVDNQIRQLELQLSQVIAIESSDQSDQARIAAEVRRIHRELAALRDDPQRGD